VTQTDHNTELNDVSRRYLTQYSLNWSDYGYRWHPRHPLSVYYRQAQERALIGLLNAQQVRLDELAILDVGCGYGVLLRFLVSLGANPSRAFGGDLVADRLREARRLNPALRYTGTDGAALPFESASFDLVTQFTVFSSLSRPLRASAAQEMLRVLRPGGQVLWYDMRGPTLSGPPWGIEIAELASLFPGCTVRSLEPLHAAISLRLLHRAAPFVPLVDRVPWLRRSHYLALLQKHKGQ
jgi:SAM-dependent methyltransferase